MKKLFLLFLILHFYITAYAKEKAIRLFVKTFETKAGVSTSFAEKLRDKLVLYFFQQGGEKYRVLSEEDIKIMYQQAEALLAQGCNADECLMQIAYAIDADIIVYGKLEKTPEGKINLYAQSLVRNRETDELSKQSIVSVSFFESQLDWFAKEVVKKLINPDYFIDESKAPLEIKVQIAPASLKPSSLKTAFLKILKFKTDDTALLTILSIFRNIIAEGDTFFNQKEYAMARNKYQSVIDKIETKLTKEKQEKLSDFKKEVYDRITATYSAELQQILDQGDKFYSQQEYELANEKYNQIDSIIDSIETPQIYNNLLEFKNLTAQRRDLIRIAYAKEYVIKGDAFYSEYKFESAINSYQKALYILEELETENPEFKKFRKDIINKKEIARTTGKSYFRNKVKSYCDRIEVFNVREEEDRAKDTLLELYEYIKSSYFSDQRARDKFHEMENLLGVDIEKEIEAQNWYDKLFSINIELGGGHLFNLITGFHFSRFFLGAGFSYDTDELSIYDKKISQTFYNITGIITLSPYRHYFFWSEIRLKAGYEYVKAGDITEKGSIISPDLLFGYRFFYLGLCFPVFRGEKGTATVFQISTGIRLKI